MRLLRFIIFGLATALSMAPAEGQTFRHAGTQFEAVRPIRLPDEKNLEIGVAEFHHHGLLNPDGKNVLVLTADRKPTPTRVLQQGPGDLCRVAFQTAAPQREYLLFYGGQPPRADDVPPWTSGSGLLLETREYRQCNLNNFESVKDAFEASKPIGSGYVNSVEQGSNPFTLAPAPFLSRYSGTINIPSAGKYGFLTSSEDCSFLLIDGQIVVSSPGRHGPERQARPGSRGDVQLTQGPHKFEYYHAASGPTATMVAVWEPNPRGEKPAPVTIPPSVFGADAVGPVLVGSPETEQDKLLPHFAVEITGSVPLPDNSQHLLAARFENLSAPALLTRSKLTWDFGDGQTSQQPSPELVFLRPGHSPVTLTNQTGVKRLQITYT
ncbi:MAG: PA14 domain-containing protein, partial [Thermoguttaceae bacterium]